MYKIETIEKIQDETAKRKFMALNALQWWLINNRNETRDFEVGDFIGINGPIAIFINNNGIYKDCFDHGYLPAGSHTYLCVLRGIGVECVEDCRRKDTNVIECWGDYFLVNAEIACLYKIDNRNLFFPNPDFMNNPESKTTDWKL